LPNLVNGLGVDAFTSSSSSDSNSNNNNSTLLDTEKEIEQQNRPEWQV
jgi:hypothetical protein